MNLDEWTEKIISMFREERVKFGYAVMILDNVKRALDHEVIGSKNTGEK